MVVPANYGAGVKTTVLQAWALGRPVVATTFAVDGLPAVSGENLLVGVVLGLLIILIVPWVAAVPAKLHTLSIFLSLAVAVCVFDV